MAISPIQPFSNLNIILSVKEAIFLLCRNLVFLNVNRSRSVSSVLFYNYLILDIRLSSLNYNVLNRGDQRFSATFFNYVDAPSIAIEK
jgi:hypothetical protein